jgi:hypothetical protein
MLSETEPLMPPRGRPEPVSGKPASKSLRKRRPSVDVVEAKEALDLATAQTYSENVFLFVPNLIGTLVLFWLLVVSQLAVVKDIQESSSLPYPCITCRITPRRLL